MIKHEQGLLIEAWRRGELHMTDTKDDPFAKAAPRPWLECGHDRGGCDCGQIWSLPADAHIATTLDKWEGGTISHECRIANAALIAAAVNAFNPEREQQIRELVRVAGEVSATYAHMLSGPMAMLRRALAPFRENK